VLRISVIVLAIVWGSLSVVILAVTGIANFIPTNGTLLLTNNIFLDRLDRFEIIDLNQRIRYSFSPDVPEGTLDVSLAPDGRKMAVVTVADRQFSLSIIGIDGQPVIEPLLTSYALDFEEVRWSENGRYLMYYDAFADSDANIFILDTATGNLTDIPSYEGLHPSASWSHDEQQIAYTDIQAGETTSQIWIADINGENRLQLTDNDHSSYCPTWSPDGETIAYIETQDDGDNLRYVTIDGNEDERYFSGTWNMTSCPSWSNNGRYLIFVSLDLTTYQTDVIRLDVLTGEEISLLEVEQIVNLQLWR